MPVSVRPALDDRDHQVDERLVALARPCRMSAAAKSRAAATTYASARIASVCDFISISMRRTSGWRMIGTVLPPPTRSLALQRAPCAIRERALEGALGDRHALQADAEARRVHHDEHVLEAAVLLADEVADGLVEHHHRGRARVDAELVLDRGAARVVALAERAVGLRQELRHEEERDALHALGRVGRAREHEVDDVLGEVVLAVGDEDLLAGDQVVVALRLGLRPDQARGRSRPAAR